MPLDKYSNLYVKIKYILFKENQFKQIIEAKETLKNKKLRNESDIWLNGDLDMSWNEWRLVVERRNNVNIYNFSFLLYKGIILLFSLSEIFFIQLKNIILIA